METASTNFKSLVKSIRYWLLGRAESESEYYEVLKAMQLCLEHHNGVRNDGEPEAIHQFSMACMARSMIRHISNPVRVLILIFLHDIVEDPNQKTKAFISIEQIEAMFGDVIAEKVRMVSKEILGKKNPNYSLETIFADEDLSVVKGFDRVHNVSSMYGVFKPARLQRYIDETENQFIDLIKSARQTFYFQESVYEMMKLILNMELKLIKHLVMAETTPTTKTMSVIKDWFDSTRGRVLEIVDDATNLAPALEPEDLADRLMDAFEISELQLALVQQLLSPDNAVKQEAVDAMVTHICKVKYGI
jgi:(p)ppGpp synthase/HD superfamily hydrolase